MMLLLVYACKVSQEINTREALYDARYFFLERVI